MARPPCEHGNRDKYCKECAYESWGRTNRVEICVSNNTTPTTEQSIDISHLTPDQQQRVRLFVKGLKQ